MKPSHSYLRASCSSARLRDWLVLFIAFGLLDGCLSRPSLTRQSFTFGVVPVAAPHAIASTRVLGIRNLLVAAPFDGRSLVYRTGEFAYERDPYAELLVAPDEDLLSPIRVGLRQSGAFAAVLEPGTVMKPNIFVEIYVYQLYGDFRQSNSNAAVLAVDFVFLDATDGVAGKVILSRTYSRRLPLKERTPSGLMDGWTVALGQILTEASADLERAEAVSELTLSLPTGSSSNPF